MGSPTVVARGNAMSEAVNATGPAEPKRRGGARFWILAIVIGLAVIIAGLLIYQASFSAFTAQTSTGSTGFSTGSVAITNDKTGSSVFDASGLGGGDSDTATITVEYTGSLDAEVRLYAETPSGSQDLADSLTLTITPNPTGGNEPWTGTLAEFQADSTDWASGVLPIDVSQSANTIEYTVTYTLAEDAPQGTGASVVFVWEAQNT